MLCPKPPCLIAECLALVALPAGWALTLPAPPPPPGSYSPHITEMRVVESRRVRRSKLYYLRERTAKELRT